MELVEKLKKGRVGTLKSSEMKIKIKLRENIEFENRTCIYILITIKFIMLKFAILYTLSNIDCRNIIFLFLRYLILI